MALQAVKQTSTIRDRVSAEEWRARVDLAAGHRVLAHYGDKDWAACLRLADRLDPSFRE